VGQNGVILSTIDSGDHWHLQESGTTRYLKSVYFIDEHTGWIVGDGGLILKTVK